MSVGRLSGCFPCRRFRDVLARVTFLVSLVGLANGRPLLAQENGISVGQAKRRMARAK
jgi:hypothetical protein